jgi:hypothetical protein
MLNTGHTYGTITDTMGIITTEKKEKYLNTLETFNTYRISEHKLFTNDICINI